MSKLLVGTLDRVSENNNEYRKDIRRLNAQVDERTTALVGDIVTLSNYTIDFSNTINVSKEKLVNPILRSVESYVIRDLRSVELVNEQFIDKINDKIENTDVTTDEEKQKFISNLETLLNEKYLEIVNIKRVPFTDQNGNIDIENAVADFVNGLAMSSNYDENSLSSLISNYKNDIYNMISKTLTNISSLYLNNFVSEVDNDLKVAIKADMQDDDKQNEIEEFRPYIPEINPVIPNIETLENMQSQTYEKPEVMSAFDNMKFNEPAIDFDNQSNSLNESDNNKKGYDVEEILKIAKSPVAANNDNNEKEETEILTTQFGLDEDINDTQFDEHELVEEMIRRFKIRIENIDQRQAKYDEDKKTLDDDQAFVNNLIDSARQKKKELDEFEEELNTRSKELDEKERDLRSKINNILPFANAVLENDKES